MNYTKNESLIFFELSSLDKKLYLSVNKTDIFCENDANCNSSAIKQEIEDIKAHLSNISQNFNDIISSKGSFFSFSNFLRNIFF